MIARLRLSSLRAQDRTLNIHGQAEGQVLNFKAETKAIHRICNAEQRWPGEAT